MKLNRKLEAKFDPTDANQAMQLAYAALKLAIYAERAIWCHNHPPHRMGRDDVASLQVSVSDVCVELGIMEYSPSAAEHTRCINALLKETSLPPMDKGDSHD